MRRKIRVKPTKSQSILTMVIGVAFVIIGVTKVIPSGGLFGFVWTLAAFGITIFHAVNAFTNQGLSTTQYEIMDEPYTQSVEDRLRVLDNLYQKGLITSEELNKKRAEILKDL